MFFLENLFVFTLIAIHFLKIFVAMIIFAHELELMRGLGGLCFVCIFAYPLLRENIQKPRPPRLIAPERANETSRAAVAA